MSNPYTTLGLMPNQHFGNGRLCPSYPRDIPVTQINPSATNSDISLGQASMTQSINPGIILPNQTFHFVDQSIAFGFPQSETSLYNSNDLQLQRFYSNQKMEDPFINYNHYELNNSEFHLGQTPAFQPLKIQYLELPIPFKRFIKLNFREPKTGLKNLGNCKFFSLS